MDLNSSIAVIGEGSWATAIVKLLLNNINKVNWYIRDKDAIDYIQKNHHNPNFSSSIELDISKINLFNNSFEAIIRSEIIFVIVPSAFLKITLSGCPPDIFKNKLLISAIKGIVPDEHLTVCEYFNKAYDIPLNFLGVISGPTHAEEVALERLTYLTISCENSENSQLIASLLNCRYIKSSLSDDVIGTEYAAVLKNIMAVAAGICHSLGYGDNFQAVLISNAIQEIKRFVDSVHPITRDIKDSAYLGDLIVTAYSQFSRNRTFGTMIGKGYSVKSAQLEMNMVAEGYYASKSIWEINKNYGVYLPICNAVYNILYEKISPVIEIRLLTEKIK
jgi:glycerol-3-phosphate dehydrogenase (NAD(P)+)